MYVRIMMKIGEAAVGLILGLVLVIFADKLVGTMQKTYYKLADRKQIKSIPRCSIK